MLYPSIHRYAVGIMAIIAVNLCPWGTSEALRPTGSKSSAGVTIFVCTGPDCRVDGASGSLRALQQAASKLSVSSKDDRTLAVKARNCIGACGDGPCCTVIETKSQRRVIQDQPSLVRSSLVSPELFGCNPVGIYQVRTQADVDFVLDVATQKEPRQASRDQVDTSSSIIVADSTRQWYDRPNNERKVLQRAGQLLVLVGCLDYAKANDEGLGTVQYVIAAVLILASNFVMKDNLFQQIFAEAKRRTR